MLYFPNSYLVHWATLYHILSDNKRYEKLSKIHILQELYHDCKKSIFANTGWALQTWFVFKFTFISCSTTKRFKYFCMSRLSDKQGKMFCSFNFICFIQMYYISCDLKTRNESRNWRQQIAHFITRQQFSGNLSTKHSTDAILFVWRHISWYVQQITYLFKSFPCCIFLLLLVWIM